MRIAALCAASLLAAQQPEPLTLRTTARLVEVSLVVQDAKGRAIIDLTADDIEVLERGRPQKIARFVKETAPDTPPASPAPATPSQPNIVTNRADTYGGAVTVLLIDTLNTPWADQSFAKERAASFLKGMRPTDRAAIYLLGRSFAILHDFTGDRASLEAKLAAWRGEARPGTADSNQPVNDSGIRNVNRPGDPFKEVFEREADLVTASRPLSTLLALESVAHHLAAFPGRKNLLWITGGLPLTMNLEHPARLENIREKRNFGPETVRAVRALNAANVALYSIDARGLFADPQFGAAVRTGREARNTIGPGLRAMQTHWEGMGELAEATGGRLFINRNDIDRAVAEAVDDGRVTYTLAYTPDDAAMDGKWRDIKVRVRRDGARVRHRAGYYAKAADDAQDAREAAFRTAAWSPVDASVIGLTCRAALINDPQPDTIGLLLQIDMANVAVEHRDGRWTGSLEVMALQRDREGRRYGPAESKRIGLHMDDATYADARKNGLMWPYRLPREKQASELKIIVRDNTSGAVGSVTVPHSRMEVVR